MIETKTNAQIKTFKETEIMQEYGEKLQHV